MALLDSAQANSIPSRLSRPDRERGRKTPLYNIYCLSWETIIPGDRSYASSSHKNLRIGPQASASAYATTSHKTMQFGNCINVLTLSERVTSVIIRQGEGLTGKEGRSGRSYHFQAPTLLTMFSRLTMLANYSYGLAIFRRGFRLAGLWHER
ncbi:hypothetical protein SISNIDRAFT_130643 [Sistotremastrum niveocremeum HHB9708]|uniref:Uncharacterized protein n=1 Tax=Sistotremastrum niveocremeum HHB9708 TaxID=1314777 RepID=A0A164T390_9AGAM|nr:hypothetical protein SISNIDRAFT_130643 [Sistotremastrum niveocremeum HHB9708]